jgi:hypothetical protein
MEIHQGEGHRVEHGEYVGYRRKANAATILAQESIAPPMQTIFHGPMSTIEVQETLWRTPPRRKTCPAVDDLHTRLVSAGAFASHSKHLPHLTPVPAQIVRPDQD